MEQLSVDIAAQIQWSNWSHCESSFNLVLVPHHPGVYALAEEVEDVGEGNKRKLAIFSIQETGNLAYATSNLFALGNPVGEHMVHSRCYVRYAVIQDPEQRHAVHAALQAWLALNSQRTSIMKPKPQAPKQALRNEAIRANTVARRPVPPL